MSEIDEAAVLQVPLDEIEKARLLSACQDVLTPSGMMLLRRLMFQADALASRPVAASEEQTMLAFLSLCVPSLSPDAFDGALAACRSLEANRSGIGDGAVDRCLAALNITPASAEVGK